MDDTQDPFLLDLPKKILDHPFLIEASAGTGKTYVLTRLVFAYLIYKKVPIEKIIVITFTNNATSELRERLHALSQEFLTDTRFDPIVKAQLQTLVADFDRLSVMTINGFFQKIYLNTCLETGFNPSLKVSADRSWQKEIAQDYFRRHVQEIEQNRSLQLGLSAFLALIKIKSPYKNHVEQYTRSFPDGISWLVENVLEKEFLTKENIAPDAIFFAQAWERELHYNQSQTYHSYHEFLHGEKKHLESLGLNKTMALQASSLTDVLILLDKTKKSLKDIKSPLAEKLYQALQPLIHDETYENIHLASMAAHFLRHFFEKCQIIKKEKLALLGKMSHDYANKVLCDLLIENPSHEFALSLNPSYQVALIDEFQDTNSFQWALLQQLFSKKIGPNHTYALIGDPKQLIYYFRGANPQTYLQAKKMIDVAQQYTMKKNYRSHPTVLNGINMWFSQVFSHTDYGYTPVVAGREEIEFLTGPAFNLYKGITFLESENTPEALPLGQAKTLSYQLYIHHILALLTNPEYQLKNPKTGESRRVLGSDIVCLVQQKSEAKALKIALTEARLPCVLLLSEHSIFDSQEFVLILLFLEALSRPNSKKIRHKLLTSALFGLRPPDLLKEETQLEFLEKFYENFHSWQHMANTRQFSKIFDQLFREYGYFSRIIHSPDAEGRIVNMRHLVSLVLQEERTAGAHSGAAYFYQRMNKLCEEQKNDEMAQIQLETENHAIRISNIHQVKGLEYPIVFAFFGCKKVSQKKNFFTQKDSAPFIDFSCNKTIVAMDWANQDEEILHAFYVLATRAKSHLFFPLLPINKNSYYLQCLAHLVSESPAAQNILKINPHNEKINQEDVLTLLGSIRALCAQKESPFALKKINIETHVTPIVGEANEMDYCLSLPQIQTTIGFHNRIMAINSYSSLWKNKFSDEEEDHVNEIHPDITMIENLPLSTLTIPGGTALGNAFHHIVETLPFHYAQQPIDQFCADARIEKLSKNSIQRFMNITYHRQSTFLHIFKTMLWNTLNVPIPALKNTKLCDISLNEKRHEVEFLMHMPAGAQLKTPLHHFDVKKGFLRGFLDLVFVYDGLYYVLDWKTTSLGYEQKNYHSTSLSDAMIEHGYDMQARLYLYVLTQCLYGSFGKEGYDKIGGAIYLFNRGISPLSNDGIYFFKPTCQEILSIFEFESTCTNITAI
ncbi:MAG: UvrD-helicase domain-containing protein [Spirochaetia bacterium]